MGEMIMKKRYQRRKRAMTLLEVMIVIFIIGIISSVIGYNMKGSLEKAKAFKTTEGIKKLHEIFDLEIASGTVVQDVLNHAEDILKASGLVNNPKDLLKDGWGERYDIQLSKTGRDLIIHSEGLDRYKAKQSRHKKKDLVLDDKDEEEEESS